MSGSSSIEWTDATWNPVRGCSHISDGCRNCYAERFAARMPWGRPFAKMTPNGPRWTGVVRLIPERLDEPLHWKRPRRVFVNSTSDLFHGQLAAEDIAEVFRVMARCPQHTFQVLTKRAERMAEIMPRVVATWGLLPNVWLGVSVEDQITADARIPRLLHTPAAKRFVSYEPALGPVDFKHYVGGWCCPVDCVHEVHEPSLDWVIVGGESGPGARPFDLEWARATVAQCREANVACFVKQLGSNQLWPNADAQAHEMPRRADPKGGDPAEWPEDIRVREFPA